MYFSISIILDFQHKNYNCGLLKSIRVQIYLPLLYFNIILLMLNESSVSLSCHTPSGVTIASSFGIKLTINLSTLHIASL